MRGTASGGGAPAGRQRGLGNRGGAPRPVGSGGSKCQSRASLVSQGRKEGDRRGAVTHPVSLLQGGLAALGLAGADAAAPGDSSTRSLRPSPGRARGVRARRDHARGAPAQVRQLHPEDRVRNKAPRCAQGVLGRAARSPHPSVPSVSPESCPPLTGLTTPQGPCDVRADSALSRVCCPHGRCRSRQKTGPVHCFLWVSPEAVLLQESTY